MIFYAGAWSHQRDNKTNVLASVERRTLGSQQLVLLVALEGDMAGIALELLKTQLAAVTTTDNATATALVAAVPPMLASSIAVALLSGAACFTAARNSACFLQRAASVTSLRGDTHVQAGDYVIVSTRTEATMLAQFTKPVLPSDALRNDLLDDVLSSAVAQLPNVGVAAALATAL